MATNQEHMNERIRAGEFGNPVDLNKVNAAWAEIVEQAISTSGQPVYHKICGVWAQHGGKVAFKGRASEDINIPMHAKILLFNKKSENEKSPDFDIVWVEE
jgi:putative alpha-1,2-mannosidase